MKAVYTSTKYKHQNFNIELCAMHALFTYSAVNHNIHPHFYYENSILVRNINMHQNLFRRRYCLFLLYFESNKFHPMKAILLLIQAIP